MNKTVRVSNAQLDRLILLAQREVQLAKRKARALGVSAEDIDQTDHVPSHRPKPGDEIELNDRRYILIGTDDTGIDLHELPEPKATHWRP